MRHRPGSLARHFPCSTRQTLQANIQPVTPDGTFPRTLWIYRTSSSGKDKCKAFGKGKQKRGGRFGNVSITFEQSKEIYYCGPSAMCHRPVASCTASWCLSKLEKGHFIRQEKHSMLSFFRLFFSVAASALISSAAPCHSSPSWSSMVFQGPVHLPPLRAFKRNG